MMIWIDAQLSPAITKWVREEFQAECGERYFHARTLDEIDRLLGAEHEVKDRIEVEVVSLE